TVEMLHIYARRRVAIRAGWCTAALFSVFSFVLVFRVDRYWWGYYPRYRVAAAVPFLGYFAGYLIAAVIEIVRAYPESRGIERKRLQLLLVALGIAYLGCVDFLPKFGVDVYPFGFAPILGFVGIVAVMFRRYDLVALTPSLA